MTTPAPTCSTPSNTPRPSSSPPPSLPTSPASPTSPTPPPSPTCRPGTGTSPQVVRRLEAAGHRNPTVERQRLDTARAHRGFLHHGARVRALDWDNVGTVTAIVDVTGTAYVHFVSPDGRQATKCLHWWEIKPIDHPDPAELTADAVEYFELMERAISEDEAVWHRQLADHGIDPDEPVVVPAAIDHRTRQVVHRLAGDQPDWLTWWLGERPRDPAGKQVWDDEVAALATWRDTHHLDDDTAGYGPPPDRPPTARAVADQPATQPRRPPLAARPPTRTRPRPRHRTHRGRDPPTARRTRHHPRHRPARSDPHPRRPPHRPAAPRRPRRRHPPRARHPRQPT